MSIRIVRTYHAQKFHEDRRKVAAKHFPDVIDRRRRNPGKLFSLHMRAAFRDVCTCVESVAMSRWPSWRGGCKLSFPLNAAISALATVDRTRTRQQSWTLNISTYQLKPATINWSTRFTLNSMEFDKKSRGTLRCLDHIWEDILYSSVKC